MTVSVNKLQTKGYVKKRRAKLDGRVVYVTLTERGAKVNRLHQHFHTRMVNDMTSDLDAQEREVLLRGLRKLSAFFER